MRRLLLALLAAALLPWAMPGAQAQGAANCAAAQFANAGSDAVWCDNFSGSRAEDWTPSVSQPSAPTMQWQKSSPGSGDDVSWFAGTVINDPQGEELARGYISFSQVILTSPPIDLGGKLVTAASFEVRGEAEPTFDFLDFEIRAAGTSAWTRLGSTDGQSPTTQFTPMSFSDAAALSGFGSTVQLRFVFTTDAGCDTFDPSCGDPSWPGFWVDNVVLRGVDPPAPPVVVQGSVGNAPPSLANATLSNATLDLTNATQAITIAANITDDRGIVLAEAFVIKGLDLVKVQLSHVAGPTWSGTLASTDDRLSTGLWTLSVAAYDADGGVNSTTAGALVVTASNPGPAPTIVLAGHGPIAPPQLRAAGGVLDFDVSSNLLRRVTYQVLLPEGGMGPEIPLTSPYIVGGASLVEGPQQVLARVYDRAGRLASTLVNVTYDTRAPQLELAVPGVVFQGIPFQATVVVKEASAHTVTVRSGDQVLQQNGTGSGAYAFNLTFADLGNHSITASVQDIVGNVAQTDLVRAAVNVTADIRITGFKAQPASVLAGTPASLRFDVAQQAGWITVPVQARAHADGLEASRTVNLSPNGTASIVLQLLLPPGRHDVQAEAVVPVAFHQTRPDLQVASTRVEVFLGEVLYGNQSFRIRVTDNGVPSVAVDANNRTYLLTLDQVAGATRYTFEADGVSLAWDPSGPVSQAVPLPEEAKDTPASGFLAVALVALALAARRRRL